MNIGIIGLGKLGLPVAVAIDNKGHNVLGYDINPKIVPGVHPKDVLLTKETDETGKNTLQPMLEKSQLKFAANIRDILLHGDIIFVAIQTPHKKCFEGHVSIPDDRADFDYTYLIECMNNINKELNEIKQKKIVTIISTVLPGTLRKYVLPSLSPYVSLCYNPFFILMLR